MTGLAPGNIRLCTLALDVKTKFNEVFKRFSTCHMMFNSGSTVDTQTLGMDLVTPTHVSIFIVFFKKTIIKRFCYNV